MPSRNPKFHRKEIEYGVGNPSREFFVICMRGSVVMRLYFFI